MTKARRKDSDMSVADVFIKGGKLLGGNFLNLFIIALVPTLISIALFGPGNASALNNVDLQSATIPVIVKAVYNLDWSTFLWFSGLVVVVNVFFQAVLFNMLTMQHRDNERMSFLTAIKEAWPKMPVFVLVVMVYGLAVVIGAFMLFLPSLLVVFFLSFSLLVVLDEPMGPVPAMRASYRLVRKRPLDVLMFMVGAMTLSLAVALFAGQATSALNSWVSIFTQGVVVTLLGIYVSAVAVVMYFSIRWAPPKASYRN